MLITNILYPKICYSCKTILFEHEEFICDYCRFNLPYTFFHRIENNVIEKLFWGKINIEKATAYLFFTKKGGVQSIIHYFKYKDKRNIGLYFGKLAGEELSCYFSAVNFIIPVPMFKKKQRQRGYNQSELICAGLSEVLKKPYLTNVLIKTRETTTQTKKNKYQRYLNSLNLYKIDNSYLIENSHVLLVDDVLTTGATIEACATELLKYNVKISVFTLVYAR